MASRSKQKRQLMAERTQYQQTDTQISMARAALDRAKEDAGFRGAMAFKDEVFQRSVAARKEIIELIERSDALKTYMTEEYERGRKAGFSQAGWPIIKSCIAATCLMLRDEFGMEEDDIANYLRMPVLLKSPAIIVDTVMWLHEIVSRMNPGDNLNMAVVNALKEETPLKETSPTPYSDRRSPEGPEQPADLKALADDYEYAYWLGYIYRCECHMHDESSRMVYGAFSEPFMRDFYDRLAIDEDTTLTDCAPEICRRLDAMLVGKLWK